jgi:nicotinamidase-related amidase
MSEPASDGGTALLVIDMLNPYEHADAERLARNAAPAVEGIATLVRRALDEQARVIYVNDNYGDWDSSPEELTRRALAGRHPELVEPILPPAGALFVLKPRHSAFFQTPLEYLLEREGIARVVLTGQVTEQCILYSALDAYVRHMAVAVPTDAVAHIHEHLGRAVLEMMEVNMAAELTNAAKCALSRPTGKAAGRG